MFNKNMQKIRKIICATLFVAFIITLPAGVTAREYTKNEYTHTGTGAVWGDESGRTYKTSYADRFRVTAPGWYVKQYTVSHVDCYDFDSVGAVGLYYLNTWTWHSLASKYKVASELPWDVTYSTKKQKGYNVTGLGLELKAHAGYPDTARGLYFSQIIITDGVEEKTIDFDKPLKE